jgi:hypothetical protein
MHCLRSYWAKSLSIEADCSTPKDTSHMGLPRITVRRPQAVLILEAMSNLLWHSLVLRFQSYHRAAQTAQCARSQQASRHDIDEIVAATEAAARILPGQPRCLVRSLTLFRMLRSRGRQPIMRIGIQYSAQRLVAHAWVQIDDHVIGDRPDVASCYLPLKPAASWRTIGIAHRNSTDVTTAHNRSRFEKSCTYDNS